MLWLLLFLPLCVFTQDNKKPKGGENSLQLQFNSLQKQANFYYGLQKGREADSIINKMILLAEQSMDPGLIEAALFENPAFTEDVYFSLEGAAKKKSYIDRALEYATRVNQPDLIAFANIKLSGNSLVNGELGKAEYYANTSNTNAMSSSNDTAIVSSLIQQGIVNQALSNSSIALKQFHNALDITQEKKLTGLESQVYHAMANFYKKLGDKDKGRELIYKSIDISKRTGNRRTLMEDYLVLPLMCVNEDLECQREALRESIHLADSLGFKSAEMEARRFQFYTLYSNASSDNMISILNKDAELKDYLTNISPGTFEWTMGEVYLYGAGVANIDSALFYLRKAEGPIYMNSVMIRKKNYLTELAMAYRQKDIPRAIETNKNLLNLEQQTANYTGMRDASFELKNLYGQQADYQQAFHYNKLYDDYTDKIILQAKEDEIAVSRIENDRKEKARIEKEILLEKQQQFNLQYTLIAILIFTLFIGLAMMGLYKVSHRTVRLLGFFSFLLLFEYVTLMSKKWISHITEGTPWQDFLFMVLLALIMLPLHNWLEHQVIDYLTTKKLLKPHKSQKMSRQPEPAPVAKSEHENAEIPVKDINS